MTHPLVDLHALLERERCLVAVPAVARDRALARARAALAAATRSPAWAARTPRRFRWLAAASVAFVAGAATGVAAYEVQRRVRSAPMSVADAPTSVADTKRPAPSTSDRVAVPAARVEPLASPPPAVTRPSGRSDAPRVELRLLEQARAAVLREDFAAALAPLAEHARRFKNGWLAEEREALRVKTLAGLGRGREAELAAAAFEARFPRSPLLTAVSQMSPSGP